MLTRRVVVAPTAFKGTLSPSRAAAAIAEGLARRDPALAIEPVPISDGGDGFLECLEAPLRLERRSLVVRGPNHVPVSAPFGLGHGGLAVVESALAVGLALVRGQPRDPLGASTGGLGELLAEARQAGATSFLIGVGGSASTDGGTGMARALGFRFLDAAGAELPEGGGALRRLARIDPSGFDPAWLMLPVHVACDVDNPLLGARGAARVFGPQKGASPAQVQHLEDGLRVLAAVIERDLDVDVATVPHGGAAGGLGAGLAAFLGAELSPGAAKVLGEVGLGQRLAGAVALVTGEGRLDGQSLSGKAPVAAGRMARQLGVTAVAVVGSTGPGWRRTVGDAFDRVVVSGPPGADPAARLAAAAALLDL